MNVWIITDNDYYFNMYGIFSTKRLAEKVVEFMHEKKDSSWRYHVEEIELDKIDWQYSTGKVIGNTYVMHEKDEVIEEFKEWLENNTIGKVHGYK